MFLPAIVPAQSTQPQPTEQVPYAQVIYKQDANNVYICVAEVGTLPSSPYWRCKYISTSGSTTTISWANGNKLFNNLATSPSTLSYQ